MKLGRWKSNMTNVGHNKYLDLTLIAIPCGILIGYLEQNNPPNFLAKQFQV